MPESGQHLASELGRDWVPSSARVPSVMDSRPRELSGLAPYVPSSLVVAHPEIFGQAEAPLAGPLRESDLRDKFRARPLHLPH